jgi:replicative DNA helicase
MEKFEKSIESLKIKKYLPHNFLAEKIVLSSLLISSEAIEIVLNNLTIETFYFKNHQEIYKIILSMYKKKIPIDIITLTTFLQDNGLLQKIGGINILTKLINHVPNLIYLKEYIRLLQDKFLRRSLIKLGYKLINSGYITNLSLETLLNDLENQVFNLTNISKNQSISSSTELLSSIFLEIKQKSYNPQLSGVSSGFYDLDSMTQGFQHSDLVIIAGRPSMGKTALCLNIASNIVKNLKLPVLFFSLEMSKEQLIYRLLATESEINNMLLRNGNLNKEDWLKLNLTIKKFSSLPFFIDDSPNISLSEIRSKIKRIIFEHTNVGLIIIDYLQLMQSSKFQSANRVQELSLITRSLKIIAREFKIPIIALSQLSRNVENRINKRPMLSDLRESGSIEQDADLVLMLYRDDYYNHLPNIESSNPEIEIIIAKHRNGPIGTVKLGFDAKYTKFSNLINSKEIN